MKIKAIIYSFLTFVVALLIVAITIENPIIRFKKKNTQKIGALAIRDNESAFYKWGSKFCLFFICRIYFNYYSLNLGKSIP